MNEYAQASRRVDCGHADIDEHRHLGGVHGHESDRNRVDGRGSVRSRVHGHESDRNRVHVTEWTRVELRVTHLR